MNTQFKEYSTKAGEILLYRGKPDFDKLESLATGTGDLWHSSFEQGYKNAFPELVYQMAVFFWYLNDFENLHQCVSWRVNPNAFVIRKSVWEQSGGFDDDFENIQMQALDFGFRLNRFQGGVALYIKDLFPLAKVDKVEISIKDRYLFYRKNFRIEHSVYMIFRKDFWKISVWKTFLNVKKNFSQRKDLVSILPRELNEIKGNPSVSYIIPTMFRQDYCLQLLDDLANQIYKPSQVIVVDATPEEVCEKTLYSSKKYPFELIVKWQTTKGSCRARNEAIDLCTGEYIVFGDDDIRILPNFIENHIKLLQTYNAEACNGLDICAENYTQNLVDLKEKLEKLGTKNQIVGSAQSFSNANSCVKREFVNKLVGNDINFDGGYGEDSDFGMSLLKIGVTVLFNPFSANLHLKPPTGGYRFWGTQAKIIGKKRKTQPWELDVPVKWVKPVPSPTVMYGILKHYNTEQIKEYKYKNFLFYIIMGSKLTVLFRILRLFYKNIQFKKSIFYAKKLLKLGVRHR